MLVAPAAAQLQLGDTSMNASGYLFTGYGGSYGQDIQSSHNIEFGANGTLQGSYYNPNFLNFAFSPYYDRGSATATSQSLTNDSGFNATTNLFTGSHFPGSVGYSRAWNSVGQFAVPGQADLTTHGNNNNLNINWNELIPGLPTLSIGYSMGGSDYSVYGLEQNGNTSNHNFNLRSGYLWDGFTLGAFYTRGSSEAKFPVLVGDGVRQDTSSSYGDGYGFSLGRSLPVMRGAFSANYNHNDVNTDYLGYHFNGGIDTVYASLGLQPTNKWHVQGSSGYNSNLAGSLIEIIVPGTSSSTGLVPSVGDVTGNGTNNTVTTDSSSHSWDMQANTSYALLPNLSADGWVSRREQFYQGASYGMTTVGGGASYARNLLGGGFSMVGSLIDSRRDDIDANSLGFSIGAGWGRDIRGWAVSGNFSYVQNVQSLLVTYMNSYYVYTGSVRHKFANQLVWSLTAAASDTGLTATPHTASSSQSFGTGISYRHWIGVNGSYARADGYGLVGGGGIVPTPLPPIIPPELLVMYGGHSYSVGVGSTPLKRLTVSASFSHSNFDTVNAGLSSASRSQQFNAYVHYQYRKMVFSGGYARLIQGFSATGTSPADVSSFSVGVSRWFNFF
jgi:hypothetical protein